MKKELYLGDRVKHRILGEGTIVAIDINDQVMPYGVWFDSKTQGAETHDLSLIDSKLGFDIWNNCPSVKQRQKEQKGYWCTKESLSAIKNKKIIIYQNGIETILNYYENNQKKKTVKARCHPDDKYDFLIGTKVVLEYFENDDKPINGQYVYIGETNDCFTRGKIYMFKDGCTKDNNNSTYPGSVPVVEANVQALNSSFSKKFLKIV